VLCFAALIEQDDGIAVSVLRKIGVPDCGLETRGQRNHGPNATDGFSTAAWRRAAVSQDMMRLISQAEREAEQLKDEYVSTEHLLLRFLAREHRSARCFFISA